jgi:hypothetical protein
MGNTSGLHDALRHEHRNAHCKIYVEPSVKKAIENYAIREGLTFSEAGRALWLSALGVKTSKL